MINRIVTQGFGPSRSVAGRAGPVTSGFGGGDLHAPTVVEATRIIRHGRSGERHTIDETPIVVWAKLVEVNDKVPNVNVEGKVGSIRNKHENVRTFAGYVSARVKKLVEVVKIIVERVERRR